MRINVRYLKEKDLFELQLVEPKLRSHFIVNRDELNKLRTMLEKALVASRDISGKQP
ncbi:hypothetical protein ACFL96_04865 [Thermoproteota archaeon]